MLSVLEDERHYVSLKVVSKKFEDIPYFHQAIQHLKSYDEIFKSWTDFGSIHDEANELLGELEPMLRDRIREKASEPENYPNHIALFEKPNHNTKNQDYYNMNSLISNIYDYLYHDEQNGMMFKDYPYNEKDFGGSYKLTQQDQTIMIESKNESDSKREKLIKFLNTVADDKILRNKFIDLRSKRNELDKTVKRFRIQIKELSEDIDLGHMIRGKCRLGY